MRQRGYASVDYLATIAIVGVVLAGLLVMRPQHVGSKSPVDVIPPIVRLLGHPVANLEPGPVKPRRPASPTRQRPARPRPARPRGDGPAIVLLPEWWRSR
jgi:hypothetical protein